jgi:hypothetical protein
MTNESPKVKGQVFEFELPTGGESLDYAELCKTAPKHPAKTDRNAVNNLVNTAAADKES